jgi:predicted RNase H-like nuclease (RuvC/YqgF family)
METGNGNHDADSGLYDDIDDVKPAAVTDDANASNPKGKKRTKLSSMPSSTTCYRPKSLTDQVAELTQLNEKLQTENNNLKRNIGTLYRTATAELARKDRQIEELRQQLDEKNRW